MLMYYNQRYMFVLLIYLAKALIYHGRSSPLPLFDATLGYGYLWKQHSEIIKYQVRSSTDPVKVKAIRYIIRAYADIN